MSPRRQLARLLPPPRDIMNNAINPSDPAFMFGLIMGGLLAGAACGAVPLTVGLKRQRPGLAIGGMITCVIAGLFCGLILAVPASIVFTSMIMATPKSTSRRRSYDLEEDDAYWRPWHPDEVGAHADGLESAVDAPRNAVRAAPSAAPPPPPRRLPRGEAAGDVLSCPNCGRGIPFDGDRLPPWCPKCGNDLKRSAPPSLPVPPAAPTAEVSSSIETTEPAPSTAITSTPPT
jgi:hypothetical protein